MSLQEEFEREPVESTEEVKSEDSPIMESDAQQDVSDSESVRVPVPSDGLDGRNILNWRNATSIRTLAPLTTDRDWPDCQSPVC